MDRLRMGVIGVGTMGQRHCRVYSSLRRAELSGIYDLDSTRGFQAALQYDVPYYASLDALLDHVDAVSIASSTPAHFDLAMRCLARGVHVLIEKPMTETLAQAEHLAATAAEGKAVVLIGHIERFNPAYVEFRHVMESMTPLAIELRRLSPYERSNRDVDVVLDLMIHDIDLILDLAGPEPTLVSAYGLSTSGTVDLAVAHLTLPAGPLFTLTASRVTEQKVRSIEVTAVEAFLECNLLDKQISVHRHTIGEYLVRDQRVKYRQESIVERIQVPGSEPLAMELEHFVRCILTGEPPLVPAAHGLASLRLAHAIHLAIGECLVDARLRSQIAKPAGSVQPVSMTSIEA